MMHPPDSTPTSRVVGIEDLHDEVRSGASSCIETDAYEPEVPELLVGSHVDRQEPSATLVKDPPGARADVGSLVRIDVLIIRIEPDVLIVPVRRSGEAHHDQNGADKDGPSSQHAFSSRASPSDTVTAD
jgi:hypothetical protein